MSDPKEIVRRGYDAVAGRYEEWAASFETPEVRWVVLDRVVPHEEPGDGPVSFMWVLARSRA